MIRYRAQAGGVTKTTQFDVRTTAKKTVCEYKQDPPIVAPVEQLSCAEATN